MAEVPQLLKVQLCATPSFSSSNWAVDIYVAGERVLQNVDLRDPLNPDQRSLCRWYLEQYVQSSPYSADLAKDATHLLNTYPEELLNQLPLQEVLVPYLPQGVPGDRRQPVVSIEVLDEVGTGGGSGDTVHQIFWETLENSTLLSNSGWKVIVHRGIQPLHNPSIVLPHKVQPWKRADKNTATINILLVIARDISRNPTVYNDVTPFLASGALIEIQRQLEQSGATLQLNVEIVRPGTLASFEAHLRRSEDIHGPGYFHIVHFDLHGQVGTRKGKQLKYGFLHFCDKNSDQTKAVPAHKVGIILKTYNVSSVILNACESGRANCGDDANIAKTFQKQGVRNILAMSFKISCSAVELFLSVFYHGLLVDGSSFAASAADARRALHLQSNRPARFGLRRDLSDSFVPVVYCSGEQWVSIPADQDMRCSPSKFVNSCTTVDGNNGLTAPHSPSASEVLGRDFDVLRLEKLLLQGGCVCVHGLAGVGKSTFLRYASSIWKRTAFVDAVINIDFAKGMIFSEQDFVNAILGQLLQFTGQQYRTQLWTVNSLSLTSHDNNTIKAIIMDLLCTLRVVIILDGLEVAFTPFDSSLVPGTLDDIHAFEIWQSIKSIFFPVQVPKTGNGWYFIGTTRRQDTGWFASLTANQHEAKCFELFGLEMPDAIELSQKVISAGGTNVEQWTYEDFDWLQTIIGLLQGIPLALLEILPAQRALDIPWRLFHGRLHSGLFNSPTDLNWLDPKSCRFFDEIGHLSSVISQHDLLFLSLFSNYWHESPPLAVLQQLFFCSVDPLVQHNSWGNYDFFKARASSMSVLALDRGYLRHDTLGVAPLVHPLFTVYGRTLAFQFNKLRDEEKVQRIIVDSIQCLYSLPLPIQSSDLKQDFNVVKKPPVGNANLLTCINLCLASPSVIPIEKWPMQLFIASIIRLLYFPYTETPPWISGKYCQLLEVFAGNFKVPIRDEIYGVFFSIVISVCIVSPGRINWSLESYDEMYQRTSKMLRTLEQHYGGELDSQATISKASLLFAQQLLLLCLEREKEAEIVWSALKGLKCGLFHQFQQGLQTSGGGNALRKPQEPYNKQSGSSTDEKDCVVIKRDKTSTQNLNSGVGGLCRIFGDMVDFLQLHEAEFLPMTGSEIPKDPKKGLEEVEQIREYFGKYVREFNREQLEEDSRLSSRSLQATVVAKKDERSETLCLLEDANDNGDHLHAFEQHRIMYFDAMYGFLYGEADEQLEALLRMFRKLSDVPPDVELLGQMKEFVQEQRGQYMLMGSLFPSAAGGRQDALGVAKKIHEVLAKSCPEQVSLAQRHCDAIRENEENGAFPTHISREFFVKFTRKHGKKMRDPVWAMKLNATMESFARLTSEAYDAMKAKQFDACLQKVDQIDELVDRDECLRDLVSEQPQAFKGVRDACEHGSAFLKESFEWNSAIIRGDFDAAWSYVEDFSKFLDPPIHDWVCVNNITEMRAITEKEHLRYLMLELQNAASAKDLKKFRNIYTEVVRRWADGKLPSIDQEKMRAFKLENLEWMIEQAIDAELWEDGLRFRDEYLVASEWKLKGNPRAQDEVLNIGELCEAHIIQQSFNIAEESSDFETCLQLVDDWERLWQVQNQTTERQRSSYIIISQKCLRFLRGCYRDHCVPCARWARLRKQTVCTFDDPSRTEKKRRSGSGAGLTTRHHDRATLQAPFGCSHHCKGGYCFFD